MKTIKALVVFPLEVEIKVPDEISTKEILSKLGDEADKILSQTSIEPLVQESSTNPELDGLSCSYLYER